MEKNGNKWPVLEHDTAHKKKKEEKKKKKREKKMPNRISTLTRNLQRFLRPHRRRLELSDRDSPLRAGFDQLAENPV